MEDLDKYKCFKHGGRGHSNCAECWLRLGELLRDRNVHVIATEEDKKRLH